MVLISQKVRLTPNQIFTSLKKEARKLQRRGKRQMTPIPQVTVKTAKINLKISTTSAGRFFLGIC